MIAASGIAVPIKQREYVGRHGLEFQQGNGFRLHASPEPYHPVNPSRQHDKNSSHGAAHGTGPPRSGRRQKHQKVLDQPPTSSNINPSGAKPGRKSKASRNERNGVLGRKAEATPPLGGASGHELQAGMGQTALSCNDTQLCSGDKSDNRTGGNGAEPSAGTWHYASPPAAEYVGNATIEHNATNAHLAYHCPTDYRRFPFNASAPCPAGYPRDFGAIPAADMGRVPLEGQELLQSPMAMQGLHPAYLLGLQPLPGTKPSPQAGDSVTILQRRAELAKELRWMQQQRFSEQQGNPMALGGSTLAGDALALNPHQQHYCLDSSQNLNRWPFVPSRTVPGYIFEGAQFSAADSDVEGVAEEAGSSNTTGYGGVADTMAGSDDDPVSCRYHDSAPAGTVVKSALARIIGNLTTCWSCLSQPKPPSRRNDGWRQAKHPLRQQPLRRQRGEARR